MIPKLGGGEGFAGADEEGLNDGTEYKRYEPSNKTEYYSEGADYIIKHDGKIDIPDDIMQFIRKKCQEMRNKKNGE